MKLPALHRLIACFLLAGCALVDQHTFAPAPEAKAESTATAPAAPVRLDARTPLVTVDFSGPSPQFQELLRYAVRAAESRRPNIQYDVVAMLPNAADLAKGQGDATEVMRAIMADGVPASRIHLALRADASLASREVRIYVR